MRHDLNGHRQFAGFMLILGHGLIFAAAGPAIGTLLSPGVIFLPLAVIVSYVTSTPVALLAGLLTGAVALRLGDETRLMVFATCIGAACGMLVPAFGVLGNHYYGSGAAGMLTLYAVDGAFAAAVCTRMTRKLRLRYSAVRA